MNTWEILLLFFAFQALLYSFFLFFKKSNNKLANVLWGLVNTTTYLLNRQIEHLQKDFTQHGGIRERMTRARLAERGKSR